MTLEEIIVQQERLRQEITERERLLSDYQLIRADWEKSLPAARDTVRPDEPEPCPAPAAPAALPTAPLHVLPPVNLAALSKGYGGGIRVVTWAIRQMPGDFTVRDLAAVLRKAGYQMRVAKVSVILHRMKDKRKIEEVTTGRGRTPSLFRATVLATIPPLQLAARHRRSRPAPRYPVFR